MQTKSQLALIIVRLYGRSDANATRVKRTLRYVQILRCDLSLLTMRVQLTWEECAISGCIGRSEASP